MLPTNLSNASIDKLSGWMYIWSIENNYLRIIQSAVRCSKSWASCSIATGSLIFRARRSSTTYLWALKTTPPMYPLIHAEQRSQWDLECPQRRPLLLVQRAQGARAVQGRRDQGVHAGAARGRSKGMDLLIQQKWLALP